MQSIELTWYQRMVLWMRIGAMPAPSLKDAAVLLRIHDKLRPTDQEQQDTALTIEGMNYRWTLPHFQYGDKTIALEKEEATALAEGMDNHPLPVLVADAAWMLRLIEDLKRETTPASETTVDTKVA